VGEPDLMIINGITSASAYVQEPKGMKEGTAAIQRTKLLRVSISILEKDMHYLNVTYMQRHHLLYA